ncbi:MAG: leucine-rich repeat domain-containing protein [Bacteroidales bacterium]|nr:leucine-rich repeat domain-containing protein [Bacteroidales bacterium]
MKKNNIFGVVGILMSFLFSLFIGSVSAQNPYPDYDFKAANADGDTLYYRITSSIAPYTVAVTRCHDSVYHKLPWPQSSSQVGQPGFVYPVYDYDSAITVPASVNYNNIEYVVTAVDNEAFYMQANLKSVSLPSSVKTIREGAFLVSSLCHISMPGVEQIESYAFYQTKLSHVEIPASVSVLPQCAFYYSPLTKIIFHEGLREIQEAAFSADLIDSLVFPSTLRKISLGDNNPFSGESFELKDIACRYVEFKSGTEPLELADYTFAYFNHLENVVLSNNIVRLGRHSFEFTNIQSVIIPPQIDTIPEGCFSDCHSLSSVVLPQLLTTIERFAFAGTPMLRQISIPASVNFIGKRAFWTVSDSGLKVLDIYCEMPPTITAFSTNGTFYYTDTIYVRVPCGKTSVYQSAPGWSSYSNFIYEECVGLEDHKTATLTVYPNPVDDVLYVKNDGDLKIVNITLYDLQGRIIYSQNSFNSMTLNVKHIPAGMYMLRVTDMGKHEYWKKIVKR